MNFVGHVHIAIRCIELYRYPALATGASSADRGSNPTELSKYLLGTALPDFATIGRFQLRNEPEDLSVRAGISVHHSTDSVFHSNEWFVTNSKTLSADLKARDINRGAARACGHVGVELLLDGNLLATVDGLAERSQQALRLTGQQHLGLGHLVESPHEANWQRHLDRIGSWTLPTDYDQPLAVAQRLHRILANRPRLAFDADQIDSVAAALEAISQPVIDGIDAMVAAVASEVALTGSNGTD